MLKRFMVLIALCIVLFVLSNTVAHASSPDTFISTPVLNAAHVPIF